MECLNKGKKEEVNSRLRDLRRKKRKEIITIIVMREHLNRENESYFKLINGKPQFFKSRW